MHIEILVEDESTRVVVEALLARLSPDPPDATWRILPFGGRDAMWGNLQGVLHALASAQYADTVLVLLDQDQSDCIRMKREARRIADRAGMFRADGSSIVDSFVIRIVQTELESWFLGDPVAVRSAYPRLSERAEIVNQSIESVSDAWETLHRHFQRSGYYPGIMPKVKVAEDIAPHLSLIPGANRSHSFNVFLRSLNDFIDAARAEA